MCFFCDILSSKSSIFIIQCSPPVPKFKIEYNNTNSIIFELELVKILQKVRFGLIYKTFMWVVPEDVYMCKLSSLRIF
jgi:hypothetical protein